MRINVYSQELTDEVFITEKKSNTGFIYTGIGIILHSSDRLHHSDDDDDRTAITFWLARSMKRRESFAQTLEQMANLIRSAKSETGLD